MAIKSDRWIRQQAIEHKMIVPFSEKQVREGVISYGLSSYGYDLRVSDGDCIGARGEPLAATRIHFKRGDLRAHGHIALPMEVRNATSRLAIAGEDSAGAVVLRSLRWDRHGLSSCRRPWSRTAAGRTHPP